MKMERDSYRPNSLAEAALGNDQSINQ